MSKPIKKSTTPSGVRSRPKPAGPVASQKAASTSTGQKPTRTVTGQRPASATVGQKPASASIGQKSASATVDQKPASASVDQKPVNTSVSQKPTSPSIREKPANATASQKPALVTAGQRSAPKKLSRREQQRRREAWQRRAPILATIGGVVLVIFIFVLLAHGQSDNSSISSAQTTTVVQQLTGVNGAVISEVNTGGLSNPLIPTAAGTPAMKSTDGKPQILYIGAEYCPFCAAERWSVIQALSRFGTFSNLQTTTSASDDSYADTHTFTFVGSTYTSDYLSFVAKETQDRSRNPLQTLTPDQQQLLTTFDGPPYTASQNADSIPFIDFGGRYLIQGSGYQPDALSGLDWTAIANSLSNPTSPVTKGIIGNANYLTAAICQLTNNQPATTCQTPTIKALVSQLPANK